MEESKEEAKQIDCEYHKYLRRMFNIVFSGITIQKRESESF
jgi:hypothetical protein